jgi:hypothetical protein
MNRKREREQTRYAFTFSFKMECIEWKRRKCGRKNEIPMLQKIGLFMHPRQ